jgi:YidC/Oxa1 family membrane protein insertase
MESKGSLLRWLFIGIAVFLAMKFVGPKLFGSEGGVEVQPLTFESRHEPSPRLPEKTCDIFTDRFNAVLSTRGASLKHYKLVTAKYEPKDPHTGKRAPIDLVTKPDAEFRQQLRMSLRNDAVLPAKDPAWQLDFDSVDYQIEASDGKSCTFGYKDSKAELKKVIRATSRPYELEVELTIKNLDTNKHTHALVADTVEWRTQKEVTGGMFRVSPFLTHVECIGRDGKATRLHQEDFEPEDFKGPRFAKGPLDPGDFYQDPGSVDVAAVSNAYFSHALVPRSAPQGLLPACQLQIEDYWDKTKFAKRTDDPNLESAYRARLAYPAKELQPGESASYAILSYVGPKERNVLSAAGGGHTRLSELIDLGFFAVIAKVLVGFLLAVHSVIPNWGIAIIILTLTARTLLFPLTIPSIRSMIKMRELKPEIDALNAKFKDDAQAKGLAQMELWRKHKVNPLKGCLPQLASMPVWFALYTTLQTAVELYNIPFLWFPDLSQSDPAYVLPFIIGATSFMQQRMMPMQGGDPAQQKMMLYMMPAMFTVFMLFLPAGLGVYMFTNGVLGIIQQQAVEWHARRTTQSNPKSMASDKLEKNSGTRASTSPRKGKV